jgi:pimeloyl-ACP methyl ester carboxylesterase
MPETLLLLPGLLCDARLWRDQAAALAGRARPVVADLTRDDSLDAMARRALDSVEGRFALCGLSMGGYAALALWRLAPHRVSRLCLMDTSARPDTPAEARRRRGLMSFAARGRFRGVTPHLLPRLVHPDRLGDAALAEAVTGMAERVGPDAFLRQQRAILGRPDSRPDLGAIAVPTLVAVGSDDVLTPPDLAEEMAERIPGAVLRVIPEAAHLPPLETPATVNELLKSWLDDALW